MKNNPDENDELEIVDLDYDIENTNDKENRETVSNTNSKDDIETKQPEIDPIRSDKEDEVEKLKGLLIIKDEEIEKLKDKMLRLQAEFDNFRKRKDREVDQFRELASENIIKNLLPIFDNIERGLEASSNLDEDNPYINGLRLIHEQFWKLLKEQGVKRIQAVSEMFDSNLHYAVNVKETNEVPIDTIIDEYQIGYMLKSKVIQPSMVVVARPPKEEKK